MQGHAQTPTKGGGISSEMLTQIERNGVQSSDRVISNALATNKIDDLALNFKEQGRLDTYFSVEPVCTRTVSAWSTVRSISPSTTSWRRPT